MIVDDAHMCLLGRGAAATHTQYVLNIIQDKRLPGLVTAVILNERLGPFTWHLKSATRLLAESSDR